MGTQTKILAAAAALAGGTLIALEGLPLDDKGYAAPYLDVAGVLTDCYGNTKNVRLGHRRTIAECEVLLQDETYRIGRFIIKDNHNVSPATLAAIISWTYNVGDGAYRSSTLRKKFISGDLVGACNEMNRWVYITDPKTKLKVKSKGLENRRKQEVALCKEGLEQP